MVEKNISPSLTSIFQFILNPIEMSRRFPVVFSKLFTWKTWFSYNWSNFLFQIQPEPWIIVNIYLNCLVDSSTSRLCVGKWEQVNWSFDPLNLSFFTLLKVSLWGLSIRLQDIYNGRGYREERKSKSEGWKSNSERKYFRSNKEDILLFFVLQW